MAFSRLATLSISSLLNLDIEANKYNELIDLMMQHFLPGVTLNMRFGHIETLKLIILDILSTIGLYSLTYPVH